MLRNIIVGLAIGTSAFGSVPVATSGTAGWSNCGQRAHRDCACRTRVRVSRYVENPQVFRSEYRPRFSYRFVFYRNCGFAARKLGVRPDSKNPH